jgi:uncharacterized protein (TIGR02266 family)
MRGIDAIARQSGVSATTRPEGGSEITGIDRWFLEYARLDRKRARSELTVAELERWTALKRQLNRHFSPGLDDELADRRQSVRVPTRLCCSFESFGTFERALITNLSRGGVFIETASPLPIGAKLRMRIVIAKSGAEMEVSGVVVSRNLGPRYEAGKAGMGVQFSETAPEIVKKINDLYEQVIGGGRSGCPA